jgi:ferredoxin
LPGEHDDVATADAGMVDPPLRAWDPTASRFSRAPPRAEQELYQLRLYRAGRIAVLPPLSLDSLDSQPLPQRIEDAFADSRLQTAKQRRDDAADIFVCAHGARDCRCGVAGAEVIESLIGDIVAQREQVRVEGGATKRVRVWAISHVGGHKVSGCTRAESAAHVLRDAAQWAANAIVQPHGDWYGNLRRFDSPLLLRSALAPATSFHDVQDRRERLVHWSRWRGRLGLSDQETYDKRDEWGGGGVQTASFAPRARVAPAPLDSAASQVPAGSAVTPQAAADVESASGSGKDQLQLHFVSWEGESFAVSAVAGETLKDVAKRHGLPSIEATCGGVCESLSPASRSAAADPCLIGECATCHAYIAAPTGAQDATSARDRFALDAAPPDEVLGAAAVPSDAELDMLEYAIGRLGSSRLCCQVPVSAALAKWMQDHGGRIVLPRF